MSDESRAPQFRRFCRGPKDRLARSRLGSAVLTAVTVSGLAVGVVASRPAWADALASPAKDVSTGLMLVTDGAADTLGGDGAPTPCAFPERPSCLSLGGGLERASNRAGVGLAFRGGRDGWLHVGIGLGFQPATPASGASSTVTRGAGVAAPARLSADSPERLGAGLSAHMDVNAATGLTLGGFRSYIGGGIGIVRVRGVGGIGHDATGAEIRAAPSTGLGIAWGATAGTRLTLSDGLSLDFAYQVNGQDSDGPLNGGTIATGFGRGSGGGGDSSNAGTAHGMSMGLRLRF